jgi:hypothetical protein
MSQNTLKMAYSHTLYFGLVRYFCKDYIIYYDKEIMFSNNNRMGLFRLVF